MARERRGSLRVGNQMVLSPAYWRGLDQRTRFYLLEFQGVVRKQRAAFCAHCVYMALGLHVSGLESLENNVSNCFGLQTNYGKGPREFKKRPPPSSSKTRYIWLSQPRHPRRPLGARHVLRCGDGGASAAATAAQVRSRASVVCLVVSGPEGDHPELVS